MNILQEIEAEQVAKVSQGKKIDDFKPGDVVQVHVLEARFYRAIFVAAIIGNLIILASVHTW